MDKKLTFGELKIGDRFIGFPIDGDNGAHGGFLGTHNVFIKIDPCYEISSIKYKMNALSTVSGFLSNFPKTMHVIKLNNNF